jgi:serine/threonine protein kinase
MDGPTCSFCHSPLPAESRYCLTCGADLSDPEIGTRQRAAVKELFEEVKSALQNRYRVTDILGRGGMGAVFLAEDIKLGRKVAIKVLRPELAGDPGLLGRFEREARISAQLDHENIIPIYEVAQAEDLHYFVMKQIAGKSLDELLAGKSLPVDQGRHILWQAARGLGHAHSRGVVHRDVKPSNIMVDASGRVMITDFGISKALQSSTQYTSTGQILGTPRYVSPEQAQGLALDGRSDQYSLAVVGYQTLVGRLPLVAETVHALLFKHIYEMPVPAATAGPGIPQEISDALQRALAKEPAERFASMEEFASALWPERPITSSEPLPSMCIEGMVSGSRPALRASPPEPPPARRSRAAPIAGGVLAAVLIGVGVIRLGHNDRPETAMQPGESSPAVATPDTTAVPVEPTTVPAPPAVPPAATTDSQAHAPPIAPPAKPRPKPTRQRVPTTGNHPASRDTQATSNPPPASRSGYLTINAIPYGTVSVDGVEIGDTPIVRREVGPGEHSIRIVREGFRPDSTIATVTAGNEVRLSRTLVKETR